MPRAFIPGAGKNPSTSLFLWGYRVVFCSIGSLSFWKLCACNLLYPVIPFEYAFALCFLSSKLTIFCDLFAHSLAFPPKKKVYQIIFLL